MEKDAPKTMFAGLNVRSSAKGTITLVPRDENNDALITDKEGNEVAIKLRAAQPSDYYPARTVAGELVKKFPEWTEEFAGRIGLIGICHEEPAMECHPAEFYAYLNQAAPDVLAFIIGEFNSSFPSQIAVEASKSIRASKND